MARRRARIDGSGRLVIPASVRRELELRDGDEVVFTAGDAPREVRMMPRRAALAHAQALVREHTRRGGSAVDDLLAERREEAAREAVEPGGPHPQRRSSSRVR
jgi:AbrB family looped-hinge helix DNA binding protein